MIDSMLFVRLCLSFLTCLGSYKLVVLTKRAGDGSKLYKLAHDL